MQEREKGGGADQIELISFCTFIEGREYHPHQVIGNVFFKKKGKSIIIPAVCLHCSPVCTTTQKQKKNCKKTETIKTYSFNKARLAKQSYVLSSHCCCT